MIGVFFLSFSLVSVIICVSLFHPMCFSFHHMFSSFHHIVLHTSHSHSTSFHDAFWLFNVNVGATKVELDPDSDRVSCYILYITNGKRVYKNIILVVCTSL
jgi:hypothetical protein